MSEKLEYYQSDVIDESEKILTIFDANFSISRLGSAETNKIFSLNGNGKEIKITLSLLDAM